MTASRNYLQKYAMLMGTYMGIFWTLKFILFPLAFHVSFLAFLFVAFTIAIPFVGYYFVKLYRDRICGGSIPFLQAILFAFFMYMFASLLVSIIHYIYFQFIDAGNHAFTINSMMQSIDDMTATDPAFAESAEAMRAIADVVGSLSAIDITMQLLATDIFWGIVLAIPTGLIAMRRPKEKTADYQDHNL